MSPQISSFTVSPNYDILFFSSEIIKVVNITDFLNAKVEEFTIIDALKNFKVGGESNRSEMLLEMLFLMHSLILRFVFFFLCLNSKTKTLLGQIWNLSLRASCPKWVSYRNELEWRLSRNIITPSFFLQTVTSAKKDLNIKYFRFFAFIFLCCTSF